VTVEFLAKLGALGQAPARLACLAQRCRASDFGATSQGIFKMYWHFMTKKTDLITHL
jgi:hypothetical protein